MIRSVSAIIREYIRRALKNQKTPIAPRFIVMSNRRLSGIMPESGLCPLFIPWFHLCVGEGKQRRAEAQIPLCLKRGCPQALWLHFKCRELCACMSIGAGIYYLCKPLLHAACTTALVVSWMFFHRFPSSAHLGYSSASCTQQCLSPGSCWGLCGHARMQYCNTPDENCLESTTQ